MGSKWQTFISCALGATALLMFTACGDASSGGAESAIPSQLSGDQADATRALGEKLYATNCQTCHGSLASSAKKGRTADQIRAALQSVSMMQATSSLQKLSSSDIDAIAVALR